HSAPLANAPSLLLKAPPPPRSPLFPYTTLFRSSAKTSTSAPAADNSSAFHAAADPLPASSARLPASARKTGSRASASMRGGRISDRKSTRLNSSHDQISYAVFCLKKKNRYETDR